MTAWFFRMIGVSDGVASRLDKVQLLWTRPWFLWAGLALLVPVGFFIVRRHGATLRHMDRGLRVGLNICRIGVLVILVVVAGGPYLRVEEPRTSKPVVILLVDESASMDLPAGPFTTGEAERLAVACGFVDAPADDATPVALDADTRRQLNTVSRAELVRRALATGWTALLESAGDRLDAHVYAAARTVRRADAPALAAGERGEDLQDTALGSALEFAIDEAAGRNIAGVILISDGRNTAGPDPVEVLRRYNGADVDPASVPVPVWTMPAGSTEPVPDIAILGVMAPAQVTLGDDTEITATLFSSGFGGQAATVILAEGGEVLRSEEIGLVENTRQQVRLTFKPDDAGPRMLSVRVAPMTEEQVVDNNRSGVFVDVEERRRKILYLEGIPRWDFRFLDHALRRDRGLEVTLFLEAERGDPAPTNGKPDAVEALLAADDSADPGDATMLVDANAATKEDAVTDDGPGAPPPVLPEDAEGFAEYDAVILGDVSPAFLTARLQEQLAKAVNELGVGLVVQAGPAHMPHAFAGGPLAGTLPVIVNRRPAGRDAPAFAPFRMSLTAAGSMYPAFQVYDSATRNRDVWDDMPAFYWTSACRDTSAGGTVLAEIVHDGETFPLIAEQTSGRGRVLFLGTDSTFRWRRNIGDPLFYTFWGQAIRHVAHMSGKDSDRSWLEVSPRRVEPGDPVSVELFAVGKEGAPVDDEKVTVTVTAAGSTEILALERGPVPGHYRGTWTPRGEGAYRVEHTDRRDVPVHAFFRAAGSGREQTHPDVDEDMLGSLADSTGCRMVRLHELGELGDRLRGEPVDYEHAYEEDVWDNWLILVLLVGFYCTDVGIRRIRGLM